MSALIEVKAGLTPAHAVPDDPAMEQDSFAALERREWGRGEVAVSYAGRFARAADMAAPALVRAAGAGPGRRCLDLCCGHGNVARALVDAGARDVTGLDFSAPMLAMARARVPEATFLEGDAMRTGLPGADFDAVVIGFGVPHVPDPPALFAEVRRLLRTGGRLAYSVWDGAATVSAFAYVFEAIADHGDPSIALPRGPDATEYGREDVAVPVLCEHGFAPEGREQVDCFWIVDDPGEPFDHFLTGTARGGALLRPQPEHLKARIRDAVIRRVMEDHGPTGPWRVPIPAIVMRARAV